MADQPVALVTGAASGIGRATAVALARSGMVAVGLDTSDGTSAEEELRGYHSANVVLHGDVSNAVDVRVATEAASSRGRLTAVVNAAAILAVNDVVNTDEALWDRVFAVNVKGTFLVCRATLPLLRAGGGGCVVNVSSVHALATVPRLAAYAASKGAVLALSRQMAIDYAADGIRVIPVVVGSVDTPMSRQHAEAEGLPPGSAEPDRPGLARMAAPHEVANVIRFLVSAEAGFVTGSPVVVDGGMLARL